MSDATHNDPERDDVSKYPLPQMLLAQHASLAATETQPGERDTMSDTTHRASWRNDSDFCLIAEAVWPEDFRLGTVAVALFGRPETGAAEAARKMALHYEGFGMLTRAGRTTLAAAIARRGEPLAEDPMSDKPANPYRRFELSLSVSGDEWADVIRELLRIVRHIEVHGVECASVGGGYSTGHTVNIRHDPAMTHERWEADLDAWLEWRDRKEDETL